jgi:hypothetical protein
MKDDDYYADASGESEYAVSDTTVALIVAGTIGLALGAVVFAYRRRNTLPSGSFERAFEIARSGTVDNARKLRRKLRNEGFSAPDIEERAKSYLASVVRSVQSRL